MKTQHGNALWMILIAIALIAALTAMFTRSSNTSDDTGDYERRSIAVNDILRYAKSLEVATQNLIARGCSENQLSFYANNNPDAQLHENTSSPDSCHIFSAQGAGIAYINPEKLKARTIRIGATSDLAGIGTNCANARCSDLYLQIYFAQTPSDNNLCDALNKALGHNDLLPSPGNVVHVEGSRFTGTFGPYHAANNALYAGKQSACFRHSGGYNIFYHVLHAR